MRRLVLSAASVTIACFALALPAHAGPGGALSGELAVQWTSPQDAPEGNAWNGGVTLALRSGAAATENAARALRESGRTVREVRPFFVQSSSITALSSHRTTRVGGDDWCYDPETGEQVPGESRTSQVATGVTQPLVPMLVDQPDLNLMTGRGTIEIGLYTDNRGYAKGSDTYPFPAAGEYYMPVPGTATADSSSSACGESRQDTGEGSVFSTRGDALVPFAFALWLNEVELPVRRSGADWIIDTTRTEESSVDRYIDPLPLSMTYRVKLRLESSLREMEARCRVPPARAYRKVRSVSAGKALLRRAGFRGRYGGEQPRLGSRAGRYFPDPGTSSSGYLRCNSKAKFFRVSRAG